VLSSVVCANGVVNAIARKEPGVKTITHSEGCGRGLADVEITQRTLTGLARNPNVVSVLLVGLGCEFLKAPMLAEPLRAAGKPVECLVIQEEGGSRKATDRGVEIVREMLARADRTPREICGWEALTVGLECGGSDGYSGITANPALGVAADLVVANGGTVILSETPEIYGAEHLLINRAVNPSIGRKLKSKVDWWKDYAARHGGEMNNNPSPGNKAGGLTTIYEKSLGAVAKAGSGRLMEVYGFADRVRAKGMVFMDTPGYDLISITGMIAGGANVICFTTGRGSVLGSKPAPTLKLASNTDMYNRLKDDMDLDCGPIARGQATVEEMGREIFKRIIDTASGRGTKSEEAGLGDCEFVPWPLGAVM